MMRILPIVYALLFAASATAAEHGAKILDELSNGEIYIMNANGSEQTRLTSTRPWTPPPTGSASRNRSSSRR